MNNTLSNEEVKELYDTLENADGNVDRMPENNSDVHNVSMPEEVTVEDDITSNLSAVVEHPESDEEVIEEPQFTKEQEEEARKEIEKINPTYNDFSEAIKPYGFTEEEAKVLLNMLIKYKDTGVSAGMYEEAPELVKNLTDTMIGTARSEGQKMSKNNALRNVLDMFVNDAKMNAVFDEYQTEMDNTLLSANMEMKNLIKESIDNIRNIIPDIEKEDPEKAEKLKEVLQAFEDAKTFKLQMEYLKTCNMRKINKLVSRFSNECFYFNKKVNSSDFDIRIPDINRVYNVLRTECMDREDDIIKTFIIIISESTISLDMSELKNTAYVYRMISDIVSFEFASDLSSDEAKELFGNINMVLDEIEKLK